MKRKSTRLFSGLKAICLYAILPWVLIVFGFLEKCNAQETSGFSVEKVKPADFLAGEAEITSDDLALYLFDTGECNVEFFVGNRPDIRYKRHYRLRVLSNLGKSHAEVYLPLSIGVDASEKIMSVNGGVYHLENGKVVFEKLKNSDWETIKKDNKREVVHITFPNVKKGSIIELEYVIASPFIVRPHDWDFQKDKAAVLYSQYTFSHPQQMNFRLTQRDWLNVIQKPIINNNAVGVSPGTGRPNYLKRRYIFMAENVPGMHREPIMNATDNYRSTLMTELEYVSFAQAEKQYFFTDWDSGIDDFSEIEYNDAFLNPNPKLPFYKSPKQDSGDTLALVEDIYNHIAQQYTRSNAIYFLSATRSPKAVLADTEATSNEINWVLLATLRANGVEAYPVLYAERNHPVVREDVPIFTQFDDLMAVVKIEGQHIFLDASDRGLSCGEIAMRSYNGKGFVLNKKRPEWIEMKGLHDALQKCAIEFDSFNDGVLTGQMKLVVSGIYANEIIRFLRQNDVRSLPELLNLDQNVSVLKANVPELTTNQPLELKFDIAYQLSNLGDTYSMNTVIFDPQTKNPFEDKTRLYPVNYPTTWEDAYTCLIRLDQEKYDVVLPEPVRYALPGSGATYTFMTNYALGNLLIRSKIEINKTTFMPQEYSALKTLFGDISATHAQKVKIIEK